MALVSTAVSSKLPLCFSARPTPPEYSSSCRSYSPAGAAAADSIASVGPRLKLAHQNACTCCSLLAHLRAAPRCPGFNSSFFVDTRLQKLHGSILKFRRTKSQGGAISSSCLLVMSTESLQWIFSASAVLLMLLKNTAINRSLLVILLALEAPADAIGWLRGDYGMWTAFLALLVRLFYYIPGELELPLVFLLIVITSPYQAMDFRGTPAAVILCVIIAAYLAFQHFSRAGGLQGAFREGAVLASLAVVCLAIIPFVFFVQSFGG